MLVGGYFFGHQMSKSLLKQPKDNISLCRFGSVVIAKDFQGLVNIESTSALGKNMKSKQTKVGEVTHGAHSVTIMR